MRVGRRTAFYLEANAAGYKRAYYMSPGGEGTQRFAVDPLLKNSRVVAEWCSLSRKAEWENCSWLMGSIDTSWETNWGTYWKDPAWSSIGLHPRELFWRDNVTPTERVDSQISTASQGIISSQGEGEFSILRSYHYLVHLWGSVKTAQRESALGISI